MRLFTTLTDYETTISLAPQETMHENFLETTFHCYWSGGFHEKCLVSIGTCYFHHPDHRIVVWIDHHVPSKYDSQIQQWATLRPFDYLKEIKDGTDDLFLASEYKAPPSHYSDLVRYVLLYKYGGCWFDLDIFFLRPLDPLFRRFENEVCVYRWENQNYPNGAIYFSLSPRSLALKDVIQFYRKRNRHWGFQNEMLTFDCDVDLFVLPCSWFDPSWIANPYDLSFDGFFEATNKVYARGELFHGAFCYHWHNRYQKPIEKNSPLHQLWRSMYPELDVIV